MGNHSCTLYNDTEYDVVVVNYDRTVRMPPGDRYYPWLLKGGNYYLKIIMEFPGVWEEGVVYLYAHEFEDRTHRMSTMFNKQITEYQKNHIPANIKVTQAYSKWQFLQKHPGGFEQQLEIQKIKKSSWERMEASETVTEVKVGLMLEKLSQSQSFKKCTRLSSATQFEEQTRHTDKRIFKERCCLWQEIIVVHTDQNPPFHSLEIPTNNIEMTAADEPGKDKFMYLRPSSSY